MELLPSPALPLLRWFVHRGISAGSNGTSPASATSQVMPASVCVGNDNDLIRNREAAIFRGFSRGRWFHFSACSAFVLPLLVARRGRRPTGRQDNAKDLVLRRGVPHLSGDAHAASHRDTAALGHRALSP